MFNLFVTLGAITLILSPILLVIAIVQTIRKKPAKKKWWITFVVTLVLFVIFELIATTVECKHDFKKIEEISPTCTEKGKQILHCDKCDTNKTEYADRLEHNFNEISRIKPTEEANGQIVYECSVCGETKTEILAELSKDKLTSQDKSEKNETTKLLENVDISVVAVLMDAGYTLEQSEEIQKILNTVGISSIQIEKMTGEANQGLNAVVAYPNGYIDKNRKFMFTTENGILFYAGFKGEDLYDTDKGGFLKSYGEVHVPETNMTENQKQELLDLSEAALDDYFKYIPYYDAWGFARQDDNYMVQCEAYAKNDLKVKDWVRVKVWYEKNDDTYKVTGVEIDGIQYEPK